MATKPPTRTCSTLESGLGWKNSALLHPIHPCRHCLLRMCLEPLRQQLIVQPWTRRLLGTFRARPNDTPNKNPSQIGPWSFLDQCPMLFPWVFPSFSPTHPQPCRRRGAGSSFQLLPATAGEQASCQAQSWGLEPQRWLAQGFLKCGGRSQTIEKTIGKPQEKHRKSPKWVVYFEWTIPHLKFGMIGESPYITGLKAAFWELNWSQGAILQQLALFMEDRSLL